MDFLDVDKNAQALTSALVNTGSLMAKFDQMALNYSQSDPYLWVRVQLLLNKMTQPLDISQFSSEQFSATLATNNAIRDWILPTVNTRASNPTSYINSLSSSTLESRPSQEHSNTQNLLAMGEFCGATVPMDEHTSSLVNLSEPFASPFEQHHNMWPESFNLDFSKSHESSDPQNTPMFTQADFNSSGSYNMSMPITENSSANQHHSEPFSRASTRSTTWPTQYLAPHLQEESARPAPRITIPGKIGNYGMGADLDMTNVNFSVEDINITPLARALSDPFPFKMPNQEDTPIVRVGPSVLRNPGRSRASSVHSVHSLKSEETGHLVGGSATRRRQKSVTSYDPYPTSSSSLCSDESDASNYSNYSSTARKRIRKSKTRSSTHGDTFSPSLGFQDLSISGLAPTEDTISSNEQLLYGPPPGLQAGAPIEEDWAIKYVPNSTHIFVLHTRGTSTKSPVTEEGVIQISLLKNHQANPGPLWDAVYGGVDMYDNSTRSNDQSTYQSYLFESVDEEASKQFFKVQFFPGASIDDELHNPSVVVIDRDSFLSTGRIVELPPSQYPYTFVHFLPGTTFTYPSLPIGGKFWWRLHICRGQHVKRSHSSLLPGQQWSARYDRGEGTRPARMAEHFATCSLRNQLVGELDGLRRLARSMDGHKKAGKKSVKEEV